MHEADEARELVAGVVLVATTGAGAPRGASGPPKFPVDVLVWIGVLIVVAVVGGLVLVQVRKRVLGPGGKESASSAMEELRAMRASGAMSQAEYDATRKAMAKRFAGSMKGGEEGAGGADAMMMMAGGPGSKGGGSKGGGSAKGAASLDALRARAAQRGDGRRGDGRRGDAGRSDGVPFVGDGGSGGTRGSGRDGARGDSDTRDGGESGRGDADSGRGGDGSGDGGGGDGGGD
jgi:hypothetical protein